MKRILRKLLLFWNEDFGGVSRRSTIYVGIIALMASFFAKSVQADKTRCRSAVACKATCETVSGKVTITICNQAYAIGKGEGTGENPCDTNAGYDESSYGYDNVHESTQALCLDPNADNYATYGTVIMVADDPEDTAEFGGSIDNGYATFAMLGYKQHENSLILTSDGSEIGAKHEHALVGACPGQGIAWGTLSKGHKGEAMTGAWCISSTDCSVYRDACKSTESGDCCTSNSNTCNACHTYNHKDYWKKHDCNDQSNWDWDAFNYQLSHIDLSECGLETLGKSWSGDLTIPDMSDYLSVNPNYHGHCC